MILSQHVIIILSDKRGIKIAESAQHGFFQLTTVLKHGFKALSPASTTGSHIRNAHLLY